MATKTVKIDEAVLDKVKKAVKVTKQSIGGFVELAIEEKLKSKKL